MFSCSIPAKLLTPVILNHLCISTMQSTVDMLHVQSVDYLAFPHVLGQSKSHLFLRTPAGYNESFRECLPGAELLRGTFPPWCSSIPGEERETSVSRLHKPVHGGQASSYMIVV